MQKYSIRYTYPNINGQYFTSTTNFAFSSWKEEEMIEVLMPVKDKIGMNVTIQVIRNQDDSIVCTL